MGSLGGGGQKSKSKSWNKAYGFDINNFGPMVGMGGAANAMAGDILGLSNPGYWSDYSESDNSNGAAGLANNPLFRYSPFSDPSRATANAGGMVGGSGAPGNSLGALQKYFDSSGGRFQLGQGMDDLTSKFSSLGLSRSGPAMKALEGFRHDLVSTKLDNYLGQLGALSQQGLGAGGLITSAGQTSKSKGSGGGGGLGDILGSIGSIASTVGMLSEPSAKTKIELIRRARDGLGWFRFAYKTEPNTMREGVMADEIEAIRPWALGPRLPNGNRTVNMALVGAV